MKRRATLVAGLRGLRQSFTTINKGRPGEAIDMTLVEGPFKRFEGAWRFTPLSELTHPENVRQTLLDIAAMPGAPVMVILTFIAGGLVAFPVLLLISATTATFGPFAGFAYAAAGAMAQAVIAALPQVDED